MGRQATRLGGDLSLRPPWPAVLTIANQQFPADDPRMDPFADRTIRWPGGCNPGRIDHLSSRRANPGRIVDHCL